jgi:hypothetical protein
VARHQDHPWSAALLIESLVSQAVAVWPAPGATRPTAGPASGGGASLHSAR